MSRSIRVLVVDDEYIVRNWLSMLIEKNAPRGLQLAGSAQSGPAAIELCRGAPVDVVITDIKMAPMDGIEMIRALKRIRPSLAYGIISNYEDFGAAQEGLRLGASEYFLKAEVEDGDILRCLEELRRAILEKEAAQPPARHAVSEMELIRQQYLISLFRDNPLTDAPPERFRGAGIRLSESALGLIVLSRDRYLRELRFTSPEYKQMLRILSQAAQRACRDAVSLINLDGNLLSLINADDPDASSAVAREAMRSIRQALDVSLSACVGAPVDGFSALRAAYAQRLSQLEQRFYTQGGALCRPGGGVPAADVERAYCDALGEILSGLNRFEYQSAFQRTQALFDDIGQKQDVSPASVRRLCGKLLLHFALPGDAEAPDARRRLEELPGIPLYEDLARATLAYIDDDIHRRYGQCVTVGPIEQAVQYINRNFASDITLSTVARVVHLSESYLSKRFKEKTGESFNAYLSGRRINRAKHLLRSSNARIGAIGSMVGYLNVSYFTQVFKRVTGLSPEQYRSRHRRGAQQPPEPEV